MINTPRDFDRTPPFVSDTPHRVLAMHAALEVLGDTEAAIALLQQAVARHDPWIWSSRSLRLDRLRKDPRVAALLAATIESR